MRCLRFVESLFRLLRLICQSVLCLDLLSCCSYRNIACILVTLEVSKLLKSKVVKLCAINKHLPAC